MPDGFDIDPQLFREFLSESLDSLEGIDRQFVLLEQEPDNLDIIDQIFRPIHSIKGNSSFFGLVNVKNFAHAMENILQEIRSRKRNATKPVIDVLLDGTDLLRAMMERFAEGETSTDLTPPEEELLGKFHEVLDEEELSVGDIATRLRAAITSLAGMELPPKATTIVGEAQNALTDLLAIVHPAPAGESGQGETEATLYRVGETIVTDSYRTVCSFVREVETAQHEEPRCEAFLAGVLDLKDAATKADRPSLVEVMAALETDFTTIHTSGIGFDELLSDLLKEKLEEAAKHIEICDPETGTCTLSGQEAPPLAAADQPSADAPSSPSEASPEEPVPTEAPPAKKAPPPKAKDQGSKMLRVEEEKVDSFMSFVGELIIAGEVFNYIQKKLEGVPQVRQVAQELKNANLSFNELSSDLQKSLMAVRRMPVRNILQKMPRIVRDILGVNGKKANLIIEGEDTQIDKSLLEGLEDPLVHMIRNSVDHGVESPEEREAVGKSPEGTVLLKAIADEETFRLIIQDDGKGLDVNMIKSKAVEKGTITPEQSRTMTDQEAYRLIFGAGVSTAKQVTEISGRGVGMDVVMSNISALNGTIEIESEVGKGSTFTICLPMTVTLMVVDGLVARIGNDSYIIPISDIQESLRPSLDQIHSVSGKGEMVSVRGELHRLLRMHDLLGTSPTFESDEESTVILVECEGQTCGLMVDEVIGQQSVVLKDLGKHFALLEIIQGGAILGDGRVGLVFDTAGVISVSLQ